MLSSDWFPYSDMQSCATQKAHLCFWCFLTVSGVRIVAGMTWTDTLGKTLEIIGSFAIDFNSIRISSPDSSIVQTFYWSIDDDYFEKNMLTGSH